MATSIATQTLLGAFFFGILLQAASGALLIHCKGHGGSIFQDGRRLVLLLFLFLSALWALTDFINLHITSSSTSCQVALAFSTLSDQLARVGIEQFLLWSVGHGTKIGVTQLILQSILGLRFIVGVVLVGFTRPDFAPVCVARTSVLPIAVVVLSLDAIIITLLAVRSLSLKVPRREHNKELVLVIVGFTLWTGTSAAMILGIHSIALIVKTALPSVGLLILVGIVAISADSLLSPREGAVIPEVTSPFMTRSLSFGEATRERFEARTQTPGRGYTASSNFIVNLPPAPRVFPTRESHSTNLVNNKAFINSERGGTMNSTETNMLNYSTHTTESIDQIRRGASSSAFEGRTTTVYQEPTIPQAEFIGSIERVLPLPTQAPRTLQQKKSLFKWSNSAPPSTVRKMGISNPVITNSDSSSQPFARIKTIDLATAATNERNRREDAATRVRLIPKRPAPPPPLHSMDTALRKSVSVKRKEMPTHRSELMSKIPNSTVPKLLVGIANGSTTSASLSPGHENMRQRSPRSTNAVGDAANEMTSRQQPLQRRPTIGLPSNPRSQMIAVTRETIVGKGSTAVSSRGKPKLEEKKMESTYTTQLKPSASILHRPRPYRRDSEKDRALFPRGNYLQHRRSKSGSSIAEARKSIFEFDLGSPTNLPGLPAPPTRASELAHILSSNNKSMTFHEKIQFLFPAPPASTLTNSRRSSVPSLSRLPSFYMSDTSELQSPVDDEQKSSRESKRSRITSCETADIWSLGAPLLEADTRNSREGQPSENLHEYSVVTFVPYETTSTSHNIVDVKQSAVKNEKTTDLQPKDDWWLNADVPTWSTSDGNRASFFLDANQDLPGDKTPSPKPMSAWHRRIGDELLTFSERRKSSKSRKMPPPTPLLLNRKGNCVSVVVHSPAPSPVDSPGKAMKVLQAQLKHFDEPNHNSPDSLLQHVPTTNLAAVGSVSDDRNSRSKLLRDLEEEMGQQESLWQTMQSNFDDYNSIILTPQLPIPSVESSLQQSLQQSASQPRRNRNSITRSGTSSTSSSQSSSNNRASVWQQRLAEAQMEYLDNVPTLSRNRNLNFLSISQSQLGSPTPPESVDSGTDIESGSESDLELSSSDGGIDTAAYVKHSLWQPEPILPKAAATGIWNPSSAPPNHTVLPEAPAKDIRPRKRFSHETLPVFSTTLWSKPSSSLNVSYISLWGSRKVRPKSINVRRTSERPQRKSRRIGYLPDIVESPRPLPHKRDTLGIFQFPSGETSDSAVYHSAFSPSLQASSLVNNAPWEIKSRKSWSDPLEYSSSFFDDYDELDDYEDLDSDDDFDESTLWEISNLLLSKDIASKETPLPFANTTKEIFEIYDDEICFEMVSAKEDNTTGMPLELPEIIHDTFLDMPIRPLALTSNDRPKLWTRGSLTSPDAQSKGLPQPDLRAWESYVSKSQGSMRSKSHPCGALPVLTTSALWTHTHVEKPTLMAASLWTPTEAPKEIPFYRQFNLLWDPQAKKSELQASSNFAEDSHTSNLTIVKAPMLWTPETEADAGPAPVDLFIKRVDCHADNSLPADTAIAHKAGSNQAPLSRLTSSQLWSETQVLESEHHWISESSVGPESPSIQSQSSSGSSSPNSDTVSVGSSSTKASSLWGSLKSAGISSWNAKFSKNSASTTPTDSESSPLSPDPQPAQSSLVPVRESRVLSVRDLFESRATGSEYISQHRQPRVGRTSPENPSSGISDDSYTLHNATSQDQRHILHPCSTLQARKASNSAPGASLSMPSNNATRHSVVFTQDYASPIEDIAKDEPYNTTRSHAMPPSPNASEAGMWTSLPTNVEYTSSLELLWSKDSKLQVSNLFEPLCNETARKPIMSISLPLPVLESSGLWTEATVANSNHDWLSATNITRPQLWSAPFKTEQDKNISLMTVAENSSQDLFAHIKEHLSRKVASRPLPFPTLNTSQLFESGTLVPDSPFHWLHSTSKIAELPSHSMTWTTPVNAGLTKHESIGMWLPRESATTPPPPTLFSNPHIAPWIRKKREPMSTQEITSSELWKRSTLLPTKSKHWLIDRRTSKVQFRY